jgi:hypothetical protein
MLKYSIFMWHCSESGSICWPTRVTMTTKYYVPFRLSRHPSKNCSRLLYVYVTRKNEMSYPKRGRKWDLHVQLCIVTVRTTWRNCFKVTSYFMSPILISGPSFREGTWRTRGSVASSANKQRINVGIGTRHQSAMVFSFIHMYNSFETLLFYSYILKTDKALEFLEDLSDCKIILCRP